jgi:hypothetical protein
VSRKFPQVIYLQDAEKEVSVAGLLIVSRKFPHPIKTRMDREWQGAFASREQNCYILYCF